MDDHTTQELQQQLFIWVCTWLLGAFSDILAFGSVKIVKIDFFIKGAQFFIKSAKNRSFSKEVSLLITKNRDPWLQDYKIIRQVQTTLYNSEGE